MRREVRRPKPNQLEYVEKNYQLVEEQVYINGAHAVSVRLEHDDGEVQQDVSVIETHDDGTHIYRREESWTNGDSRVFTAKQGLLAVSIITGIFDQFTINLKQLGQEQQ